MASGSGQIRTVALDRGLMASYHGARAAAVARRDRGFFVESASGCVELVAIALLSLAGLWLWRWPPEAMLVLLLSSAWVGILGEILKYLVARGAVRREVQAHNDDRLVWTVAGALRRGKQEVRADFISPYRPNVAIFVDLLFGGIATGLMLLATHEAGIDLRAAFADPGVVRVVAIALAVQAAGLLWLVWAHSFGARRDAAPRFTAGVRGLGLFLLMFIVLFGGDEGRNLAAALTFANVGMLALAGLSFFGLKLMLDETRWLRAQLEAGASGVPK